MPLDTKGGFHLHPGAAKMHDAAPKAPPIAPVKKVPGAQEDGAKGHVELHKTETGYKTIHHPSGEEKDHPSSHAAHQAMNEHHGEDGCSPSEGGEVNSAAASGTDDEY